MGIKWLNPKSVNQSSYILYWKVNFTISNSPLPFSLAKSKENGTSTLGYHLKSVCTTSPLYRTADKKKQTTISFKPATMGESGGSLVSHSFNQERCRKAVARMCIKDNQPFSIVEDEGFQELMLEMTERDYTPYFYNETEDGEEGTRMRPKTKKKRKNVVEGTRMRMIGRMQVLENRGIVGNAAKSVSLLLYIFDIMVFLEYLRIFYDVTKKISGCKYVTSNMFVKDLVTMHAAISKMCRHADENKRKIALSMKGKYDKYWDNLDNMNVLLYVALVLDPRNKLKYLEFCLDQIYPKSRSSTETSNEGDQLPKRLKTLSAKTIEICKIVEDALKELFVHYKIKLDKHNDQTFTVSSSSTPSEDDSSMTIDLEDGFSKYLETQYGEGDDYSEICFLPGKNNAMTLLNINFSQEVTSDTDPAEPIYNSDFSFLSNCCENVNERSSKGKFRKQSQKKHIIWSSYCWCTAKHNRWWSIGANCLLNKVCSEINKPNGQFLLPNDRDAIMIFISSLPIRKEQKKIVAEEEVIARKMGLGVRQLPTSKEDLAVAKRVMFSSKFNKNIDDKQALIN
ncbi:zinc finger, BED-type [Artemisia annua]|uniref:Zinc finger, BED-type n=1 Tax=Artemisia annua TaxID=35608 RepID=A0A2U1PUW5_ARTAN|nr:zinc finger, BED-type [Artemisia annua]